MRLVRHEEIKLALGSDVAITLVYADGTIEVEQLMGALWRQIFIFERNFSRFLPDSELSVFNRSAGRRVPISDEFMSLLVTAKTMNNLTNGLYNPFILPALQRTGYAKSAVPGHELDYVDNFSQRVVVSGEQLEIGAGWAKIPDNTAIDLGGCGKGYLADQVASFLADYHLAGFLISCGGDIASFGVDETAEPWTVYIQSASTPDSHLASAIRCPESRYGIATSGTFRRSTQSSADEWHHIIDPLTGISASTDVRLATVTAQSTILADVLASCAVALTSAHAMRKVAAWGGEAIWLQCQNDARAFNLHQDRSVSQDRLVAATTGVDYA